MIPDDLNALPRPRHIRVPIRRGRSVVPDLDRLDVHRVGRFGEIGLTAGPGDGTRIVGGIATGPDTDPDVHRRLGEVLAAVCVCLVQSTDGSTIDDPGDGLGVPLESIRVGSFLRLGHGIRDHAVICRGVALAKVVCLNLDGVAAQELLLTN